MPITRINPVSPRAQPVQEEKKSNFDKVMEALSLASTALSIPADIQKIRQYQSQIDLNEQRAITEVETRPETIRTAISKREVEEIKRDIAKDEKKFRDAQDPIIRNIKNSSDRDSLGKISNAYSALIDLENAIGKDVPINTTVGSNLSTAARDRFVQFFGRDVSGAAIADKPSIWSVLGLTEGAEKQQFEKLVPGMGDTVGAARTKIDEMKEALERMAIARGVPNAQEFVSFVLRTGRPVKPLEKTPITSITAKDTVQQGKELLNYAGDFSVGAFETVFGEEKGPAPFSDTERQKMIKGLTAPEGKGIKGFFQDTFGDEPKTEVGPRGGASPKTKPVSDMKQFMKLQQSLKEAIETEGSDEEKALQIRNSLNQIETFLRSKTPNEKYPAFSPDLDAAKFDAVKKAIDNFFKSRQGIGPQSSVAPGAGKGLAGLTGVADKKVVSKQGLGSIARAEKKKEIRGFSKLIEGIQKPFPPGESTFAGRAQALLDSIFGVDKIGLDPGEKPSKSQPSEADISFIDSLIMVPGTTKVTKLTPKLRAELLKKRLEKGDLSKAETEKLTKAIDEIRGKGLKPLKQTPSSSKFKKLSERTNVPEHVLEDAMDDLEIQIGKRGKGIGSVSTKLIEEEIKVKEILLKQRDKDMEPGLEKLKKMMNLEGQVEILKEELKKRKPKKPTDLDVIKGKKKKGPSIENKKVKDLTDEEFLERLTTVNKQIEDINKMPDNSVDEDILDNLAKERVRLLDEYRRRQGQSNVKNLDLRKDKPKRGK